MNQDSPGYLTVRVENAAVRWLVCAAVVGLAAACALVLARWSIAETVVDLAKQRPMPVDALERAYAYEPANPDTSFLLGTYHLDVSSPPDLAAAERYFKESAALAPNRTDAWLALGRYYEMAGDTAEAEAMLRRASSVAPAHWRPIWMLGNLHLRQGRVDDALEPFGRVIAINPNVAPLAVRTIWMASSKDLTRTSRLAARSAAAEGALVDLLLNEKRPAEALDLWRAAVERHPDQRALEARAVPLASAALAEGRGEDFIRIWSTLGIESSVDALGNASFEEAIPKRASSPFVWSVTQSKEAPVGLGDGRTGGSSLRIDYDARGGSSFTHATQIVRVRPGARYELTFWAATDDLVSAAPPAVMVGDGMRNDVAATAAVPSGTNAWQQYRLSFTAPASGIVKISVGRVSCGGTCPLFGTVMFDDFELRSDGAA